MPMELISGGKVYPNSKLTHTWSCFTVFAFQLAYDISGRNGTIACGWH